MRTGRRPVCPRWFTVPSEDLHIRAIDYVAKRRGLLRVRIYEMPSRIIESGAERRASSAERLSFQSIVQISEDRLRQPSNRQRRAMRLIRQG
jgi:hypothetical protein